MEHQCPASYSSFIYGPKYESVCIRRTISSVQLRDVELYTVNIICYSDPLMVNLNGWSCCYWTAKTTYLRIWGDGDDDFYLFGIKQQLQKRFIFELRVLEKALMIRSGYSSQILEIRIFSEFLFYIFSGYLIFLFCCHRTTTDLWTWSDREGTHDPVRVFFANLGDEQGPHSGPRPSPQRVGQLETLQAVTVLDL